MREQCNFLLQTTITEQNPTVAFFTGLRKKRYVEDWKHYSRWTHWKVKLQQWINAEFISITTRKIILHRCILLLFTICCQWQHASLKFQRLHGFLEQLSVVIILHVKVSWALCDGCATSAGEAVHRKSDKELAKLRHVCLFTDIMVRGLIQHNSSFIWTRETHISRRGPERRAEKKQTLEPTCDTVSRTVVPVHCLLRRAFFFFFFHREHARIASTLIIVVRFLILTRVVVPKCQARNENEAKKKVCSCPQHRQWCSTSASDNVAALRCFPACLAVGSVAMMTQQFLPARRWVCKAGQFCHCTLFSRVPSCPAIT